MRAKASLRRFGVALATFAAAAAMWGCAGARPPSAGADDLTAGGAPALRAVDSEALRRGRAVYVTECGACHRLYRPGDYSPEEWRPIVGRMAVRASLSREQAADLLAYLAAAGRTRP